MNTELCSYLRIRRDELTRQINAIDVLLGVEQPTGAPAPVAEPAAAPAVARKGRKPQARPHHGLPAHVTRPNRRGGRGGFKVRDAVRQVCATLTEPYNAAEVLTAAIQQFPDHAKQLENSCLSTVLLQLAQAGELKRDASTRPSTYRRGPKLAGPTMSDTERRYRELRQEITTGGGEE